MLSRFRSDGEQRQRRWPSWRTARVDIVIGTHRLLQKDVQFKNLGLVIIDEEQRFGVAHKERLKQMRREVDVLTLTATPIPRTLYMSLSGIRDMSTMETPPEERLPIKTYVAEFDERLIREAILRELDRGGQVFFVHNRVQSIDTVARRLRELVPEAEIAVGHGQMAGARARAGDARLRPRAGRRARLHDDHRVGPGHPQRQHHHHQPGRQARAGPALPAPRPRGARRPPGLRLPALRPQGTR